MGLWVCVAMTDGSVRFAVCGVWLILRVVGRGRKGIVDTQKRERSRSGEESSSSKGRFG